jgi:recombination protein RecT
VATAISALKQPEQQAVAKKPKTIFDLLTEDKARTAIASVAGKYMTPERFLRLAINCIKKTPRLFECDPQTVLGSFMASAALGLEPNTVLQQAYLIPYGVRGKLNDGSWGVTHYDCQFQIGYRGFITLAHRSPHVITLEAEAIHEGDHFDHLKGSRSFLEYRKALKDRGELIGAFAFSKIEGGGEAATVLPLDEIHKIRSRSETYQSLIRGADKQGLKDWEKKKAEEKLAGTPWVMWEDDMSAKSAIKKHSKQLPMNPGDPMAAAVSLDADREDGKTVDMADLADVDKMRAVMEDGDVPPTDEAAPAALTNEQGGETIDFGNAQQREKVDVGHFNAQQRQAATDVDAREVTATQASGGKPAPDTGAAARVEAEIKAETNPDTLDLIADGIRSLPAADQPRLNKLYRTRRAELANAGKPAQQDAFSME